MKKFEAFLTNNGNIAVVVKEEDKIVYCAFITPKGEWLREATGNEISAIAFNYALQLAVNSINDEFFGEKLPQQAPIWEFMGSIRVEEDYSSFKPETCRNGGDYAFYTNLDIYHTMINGKSVIRGVTRYSTSAEFEYDELNASFQTNLVDCQVLNAYREEYTTDPALKGCVIIPARYDTQGYDTCFVEQISQVYKLEDIYNLTSKVIEKDEDGNIVTHQLFANNIEEVVAKLIIAGASFASAPRSKRRG